MSERERERARAPQRGISAKRDEGTEESGKVQSDGAGRDTFGMVKVCIYRLSGIKYFEAYVIVLFVHCYLI